MKRITLLILVLVLVSIQTLLLDLCWWYGPFARLYRWLNVYYHLLIYFPSIVIPIVVVARFLDYGYRETLLILVAGLSLATWVNDFFWDPVLGRWGRWLHYCFDWSWRNWNHIHLGFTPYIPWWIFSLSNILRPVITLTLLYYINRKYS